MSISYPTKVYTQKLNHIRSIPAIASATLAPTVAEWTAGIAAQIVSPVFPAKIQSLGLIAPNPGDSSDVYRWLFKVLPTGDPKWDVAILA